MRVETAIATFDDCRFSDLDAQMRDTVAGEEFVRPGVVVREFRVQSGRGDQPRKNDDPM